MRTTFIILLNLFYLSHLLEIHDLTPFEEVKFSTPLVLDEGYFKINLKDTKGVDKNNLYI